MKAVMAEIPPEIRAWRKRTGVDQWDEVWDGVLHMAPMPNREHQDLEWELEAWLRLHWAKPVGNRVYHQINLAVPGGWPDQNYRIPDLVLLTPDRFHIDHNEYFEGAPTVVVEIHSPGDEAYEKLPFFAELGVPEVWIIDRDTRAIEVFLPHGSEYVKREADEAGWIASEATGIELRRAKRNRLTLRLAGDESTQQDLPEA